MKAMAAVLLLCLSAQAFLLSWYANENVIITISDTGVLQYRIAASGPVVRDSEGRVTISSALRVLRDGNGRPANIGGVQISYNWAGLPIFIGPKALTFNTNCHLIGIDTISIDYDANWKPLRIGGSHIYYDDKGYVTAVSGDVGMQMVVGLED